jgi:hypothetical protein
MNSTVTKEERKWMEKFFREFFLESSAVYTLFGTKPISAQTMIYISAEEHQKRMKALLKREGIVGEEREKMLSEMSQEHLEYDLHKNWEKWVSFIARHPNSPFIFTKRKTLSENLWTGHILNIQQTIWILEKYYDVFKKALGFDFDSVAVTMDFKNEDSAFWEQVFANHLLSGIVYGYGYKNSYFFYLLSKASKKSAEEHPIFFSLTRKREPDNRNLSVENIILPRFRSFGLPFNKDPIFERYKLEREKIKKNLNESNFFEMVFLQLTGELSDRNTSQNASIPIVIH